MFDPNVVVEVADRPYTITFRATRTSYPLTADDVRRLLDEYPVLAMWSNRLTLPGHNTSDPRQRVDVRPATLGGGAAFVRVRK